MVQSQRRRNPEKSVRLHVSLRRVRLSTESIILGKPRKRKRQMPRRPQNTRMMTAHADNGNGNLDTSAHSENVSLGMSTGSMRLE